MPWTVKSESNVERVWVELTPNGAEIPGTARIEHLGVPVVVDSQPAAPVSVAMAADTMMQAPQVEVPVVVPEPVQPAFVPRALEPDLPVTQDVMTAPSPTPVMPLYEAPPANAQPLNGIVIESQPNVRVEGNRVVSQLPTGWTSHGPSVTHATAEFHAPTSPAPPTRRDFAWPRPSDAAIGGFVAGLLVDALLLIAHFL